MAAFPIVEECLGLKNALVTAAVYREEMVLISLLQFSLTPTLAPSLNHYSDFGQVGGQQIRSVAILFNIRYTVANNSSFSIESKVQLS